MKKLLPATLLAGLAVAGCTTASGPQPSASQSGGGATASSPAATPGASVAVLAAPPSRWGSRPPRRVTPGAGRLSLTAICPTVSAALEARRPSTAVKDKVYAEYGIPAGRHHLYRIDHLVPLELDGKNSIRNLWPQRIGASRAKDRLEDALHSMGVCRPDHVGERPACDQDELGTRLSPVCEHTGRAECGAVTISCAACFLLPHDQ
jgi:hypothetical protein